MKIIEAFRKLIDDYSEKQECGFCWNFEAPLQDVYLDKSVSEDGEDCCVRVFLTNWSRVDRNKAPMIDRRPMERVFETATVRFLMYDDIGTNVYSEAKGHDFKESKYKRILEPLMECLRCLDFCEVDGEIVIENRSFFPELDWLDDNYTGIRMDITVSFEKSCEWVEPEPEIEYCYDLIFTGYVGGLKELIPRIAEVLVISQKEAQNLLNDPPKIAQNLLNDPPKIAVSCAETREGLIKIMAEINSNAPANEVYFDIVKKEKPTK